MSKLVFTTKLIESYKESIIANPNEIKTLLPSLITKYMEYLEEKLNNGIKTNDMQKILEKKYLIYDIFSYFLEHSKREEIIKTELIDFILSKLNILTDFYFDLLCLNDDDFDLVQMEDWNVLIIEFLSTNYDIFEKENYTSETEKILTCIISSIVMSENTIVTEGLLTMIINTFLLKRTFSSILNKLLKNIKQGNVLNNLTNLIFLLPECKRLKEIIGNEEIYLELTESIQKCIISILNNIDVDNENNYDLVIMFLKKFNTHLFSICRDPLIYSEFLLKVYKGDNKEIKILSLSCLFILITKYNYIFEEYYETLYQSLFIDGIFASANSKRLLKIIYLSLKQPVVSKSIVCSFIKKLARVCLFSEGFVILRLFTLIEHIFHYHHKCLTLLYRKRKDVLKKNIYQSNEIVSNSKPIVADKKLLSMKRSKAIKETHIQDESEIDENDIELQAKYDVFNDDEHNPYITNASKSCLWEVYTLSNHYNYKIREIIRKLSKKFIKKDLFVNQVLEISNEDSIYDITEKNNFYINFNTTDKEVKKNMNSLLNNQ